MRTIYRAAAAVAALSLIATTGCSVHVGGSRHPRTARDTVVVQQPPTVVGGGPAVIVDEHHHRRHHHDSVVVDD